ncbi:NifU family protein [Patulibacter medicamentivorans]|uniref:NifU family protein n=1 Tax=Patulibacter medicamentivorans TaxID=1097667 RepID=UPI0011105486|nr:NifU family protein [Patulibacter medicamentivorans]
MATHRRPERHAVQAALDEIRPRIHAHHGDVEIRDLDEDGTLRLRFTGNCVGCPYQAVTFGAALHDQLAAVDGVSDVQIEGRVVPPAALARIRRFHGPALPMSSPSNQEPRQ